MTTAVPAGARDVVLVAGEASGDMHGADLVAALRRRVPGVRVRGIGGARLRAAGMETLVDAHTLAAMGLVEARERLGAIWRAYRRMRRLVRGEKPDLLVLIDFAEFNLALAGVAKRAGVPVLYYISPQVWAWRRGRVRKIARRVSRLAVVFPFEVPLYAGSGLRADFVGHPLLDRVRVRRDRQAFRAAHGLDPRKRLVALLPGSRAKEMQLLLPAMVAAAERLVARGDVQCVLALAETLSTADIGVSMRGAALPFPAVAGETYDLVHASDAAIVASGTATLEAALLERPMVIVYRTAALTYALARRLVSVPFIGMPNLIAGRGVVPELIQDDATAERMVAEVERFLDDPAYAAATQRALAEIRPALGGGGAAERAAAIAAEMLA
ncbi:MAG: lipid-A-disaccharide synthase [Myxococcales bacterium]|nr:lipid-A-disaccharide synthase [Myxococcales bacterium]